MDQDNNKKIRYKKIVYSVLYMLLFAGSIVMLGALGSKEVAPALRLGIGVDLMGMLTGFILGIYTLEDGREKGGYQVYFRPMLSVAFLGLFADLAANLMEGNPGLIPWNLAANTLYYVVSSTSSFLLWKFVTSIIIPEKKSEVIIDRVMLAGFILSVTLNLLNVFFGFYFYIDETGRIVKKPVMAVIMLYLIMTILFSFSLMLLNRKRLKKDQIISLASYLAGPLIVSLILTVIHIDLSVQYGVAMLGILLIYCTFNAEEYRERALAEKDVQFAANIQQSVLPQVFPPFPERKEFELHASMDPAKTVGGDFYDFFLIDDDHLCMIIGDVSGKGIPASLFMMASRTVLHGTAKTCASPEMILKTSNEEIVSSNPEMMFVTVWLGILEISTGILRTANAGHEYPAVRSDTGKYGLLEDEHGIPVGMMEGMDYTPEEIHMKPGDAIFVYTDGVPEAVNKAEEQFGTDRMIDALNEDPDADPEQTLNNVRRAVDTFVEKTEQYDDLTMLCLKYNGRA